MNSVPKPGERLSGIPADTVQQMRGRANDDLYFFIKGVLGYKDLTPRVHKGLCDFISGPAKRQLILMPRSHFKTTCNLGEMVWTAVRRPEERTLLVCESAENAEYMLNEVKDHITDNQLLRLLYPDMIPSNFSSITWNRKHIVLPRKGAYREPTIDTAGITSKVVSRHYTRIGGDDLVSDEAMYSPTVMKKACDFVNRLFSLLVNPMTDTIKLTGTRWAYKDIYSHVMENFPEFQIYLRKAIIKNPATGEPEPLFLERFTMEDFQRIISNDPMQWSTQYANDPLDAQAMDFKPEWLQYFRMKDRNLVWSTNDVIHTINLSDLNIYIHVDPSMGETPESDYTGIVVVGVDDLKRVFLIDTVSHRLNPLETAERIVALSTIYEPRKVTIESNAYQKSLMYYVKDLASRRQTYVPLEPFVAGSNKSKPARVRGALRPLFSTGSVRVREGLSDFTSEFLKFGKTHDDHLMDALAQGPEFWRTAMSGRRLRHRRKKTRANKRDLGVTGYAC